MCHRSYVFPDLGQTRGEVQRCTGPCRHPSDYPFKGWAFPRRTLLTDLAGVRWNLYPTKVLRFLDLDRLWRIKGPQS